MIKEYHVSENLFDKDNATAYDCYIASNGQWAVGAGNKTVRISCSSNTQYTISTASTYAAFRIMETGSDNIPSDGSPVNGTLIYYGSGNSYTFTTSNTAKYIIFQANSASLSQWISELMFNTGSTALPYEPYGNTWNTKSYCKATTGSKTYSNFPIVVRSREQSISSWNMKGNEQHTGTASPTSPIEINGTGERTKNLCNESTIQNGYYGSSASISVFTSDNRYRAFTMAIKAGTYTIKIRADEGIRLLRVATANEFYDVQTDNQAYTFVISADADLYVSWRNLSTTNSFTNMTVMLNTGSTALPYEPYGYKIPISANGTALTPVYLTEQLMMVNNTADSLDSNGTVTYNIYKHELTGQETWNRTSAGKMYSSDALNGIPNYLHTLYEITMMCSHYVADINYGNTGHLSLNEISLYGTEASLSIREIYIYPDGYATAADFATYLQQQYANGTPVTIWFIMETPTTEQVTVPTIPTTSSPTTIDVNTSVKPSEMSLTYDGYKICKGQKYQNNTWT